MWNLGQYTYSITVEDSCGNTASDEVVVTIEDTTSPVLGKGVYSKVGQTITWSAVDNNPGTYIISRNGDTIFSGNWVSGGLISINAEIPETGDFNYIIVVKDSSGNIASNEVIISSVLPSSVTTSVSQTTSSQEENQIIAQVIVVLSFFALVFFGLYYLLVSLKGDEKKKKIIASKVESKEIKISSRKY